MTERTFNFHLWTIGCQMNEADALRAAAVLERAGGRRVEDVRDADVALLNTCVVRQQVEDKAAGRLRYMAELKSRRPGFQVVLMGCMVGRDGGKSQGLAEAWPAVALFVAPSDVAALESWIAKREPPVGGDLPPGGPNPEVPVGCEDAETRVSTHVSAVTALVPVVLGCSHACSYCIIPYRRGPERSRPSAEVLSEVRALAARGVREVTLLGQIVDRYGLDLPGEMHLAGLLRKVAAVPGILRVRFLTSHPNWFTDDLLEAVASTPRICPAFELPVQAGNDDVLRAMRRGYAAADWRRLVAKIRARIPEATFSTDIIVGFPGETAAQFDDTVSLMEDVRPDMMRIAKYSPRPQTLSARTMPDDVPPEEKERRRVLLEELLRKQLEEKHAPVAGQTVEILVESVEPNGRRRGRTREGKLVFADAPSARPGDLLRVAIEWAGAFSWVGKASGQVEKSERNGSK